MKCPHCLVSFHWDARYEYVGEDSNSYWYVDTSVCPACNKMVVYLINSSGANYSSGKIISVPGTRMQVLPKGTTRSPCPAQVPADIAEDYNEACLVISSSPKASGR